MKEDNVTRLSACPRCGKAYHEPPALSRLDNETLICPDCGTREALDSIGVAPAEQGRHYPGHSSLPAVGMKL